LIKRILVATDFSDRSDRAVRRAALLASAFSAELVLAHVVDDGQPEHLVRAVEKLALDELDTTAGALTKLHAIACTVRVLRGDISEGIVGLANDIAVDLVVMGTHRKSLLKDVLTGTTLERVARASPSPVLVVSAGRLSPYAGVLIAVDFSECSGNAIETARALGLLVGARVTVLHISDPSDAIKPASSHEESGAQVAAGALKTSLELTRFLGTLDVGDIAYSTRVRPVDGPPALGIRQVAAELDADLVVVGRRGRNRAARMLLGSVTDDLLRTLSVDTLIMPCAGGAAVPVARS
jgi:nucleotide-binding universal stress UspA family protein